MPRVARASAFVLPLPCPCVAGREARTIPRLHRAVPCHTAQQGAECARFSSMKLKLDGYRVQVHLHDGRVSLYTRTGLDWTTRFPTIAADVARLPTGKLVIDGEVISADATGRPNFGALQDDLKRGRYDRLIYYVFD